MATQAVTKVQTAVQCAVRTTAARPAPRAAAVTPAHVGRTAVFAPRPMGAARARSTVAVQASANGTGLPIDLRGEAWEAVGAPGHARQGLNC